MTPTQNIAAYNPATGELAWVLELPNMTNSGNVVTAGDVLFQAIGRDFYALDAISGKQLTKISLKVVTSSSPLVYSARGKEFVAIASGNSVVALSLP
jgi:outer membrane protein assembly factor BamB